MTQNWLLTLNDINSDDLSLVGAKALNLAQLHRNQLSVPQSLVATTDMFEAQINHYAFGPIWAGSPDVAVTEGALQFLADFLKSTPLAPDIKTALQKRLDDFFPPEIEAFAVRSSAIDEDQQNYSFAGVHLTELGVPRKMLTVSLTRCWASAMTGRAVKYRIENGLPLQAIKIAVIIQPMIKSDTAGVAFTLDPISGARDEFVIEASTGLGDTVVSGKVNPFRYHLARQAPTYPLLKKVSGNGTALTREPLSTPQLIVLAQALDQVEALMGLPQDVEWTFQDSRLYLLQTRPITGIGSSQSGNIDLDAIFNAEWTRANHPDVLPEIPSPLFISLMERTQDRGLRFFNEMGLDVSNIGPYIKSIYGRPYLNLSMIKRILAQLGFSPVPMLTMAGYMKSDALANPFNIDIPTAWKARQSYFNLISETFKAGQTAEEYEQTVAKIIANLQKTPANPAETLTQFKLRERVYGDLIGVGLILISAMTGLATLIAQLINPLSDSPAKVFQTLGTLGKDPNIIHHNQTLWKLSRQVQTDAPVMVYLLENNNDFADYQTALAETQFLKDLESYFEEYGYRAAYEADMSYPRLAEQPWQMLQSIKQYLKLAAASETEDGSGYILTDSKGVQSGALGFHQSTHSHPPEDAPQWSEQSVKEALQSLTTQTGGVNRLFPWRKGLALPLMSLLYKVFTFRSRLFTAQARAMAAIREWDLALANNWVQQDFLETVDDYFLLTMEDVEYALVTDDNANVYLKPSIVARKKAQQIYAETSVPFVIKDADIPALSLQDEEVEDILANTLMGLPVSPGQTQGVIEFLQNVDDMKQVSKENILIVPSADPAYLPFFPLASGLIVEVGGMLSHGSIIAREYGLPAVSNITEAHKYLRTGDRVLLDGSTGVIQILEKAT